MDIRKENGSCEEARQMDIVCYLSSLGYEPVKVRNFEYWYLSPLREERTPSFKVDRKINRWYDHGLGKGGNLIDLAILYNNCTVGEFLKTINKDFSLHRRNLQGPVNDESSSENQITILNEAPISRFSLCRYLHERRIPLDLADRFCKEVTYSLKGRECYAIGFKNNSGGYELRNPYFKGSTSPKDFTSIDNHQKEIAVFEGFFDFLSFMAIYENHQNRLSSFLVLNSLSLFGKARLFMEKHDGVSLCLDNDKAGQNCRQYALSLGEKYSDKSRLYEHYKDLNDWIVNIGKNPKNVLKNRPRSSFRQRPQ